MNNRETQPFIYTYTGLRYYLEDPRPEDIRIEDIAHSLSLICRYTGHCKVFYSVSEHALRASYIVSPENALYALHHDSGEAYLGDCSRPLKKSAGMERYSELETLAKHAIMTKFNLPLEQPAEVKDADNVMLVTEMRDLMVGGVHHGNVQRTRVEGIEPLIGKIKPWPSAYVEQLFLERHHFLIGERHNVAVQVLKEARQAARPA